MIVEIDKTALLAALKRQLEEELLVVENAQKQSQAGATHVEGRAEGDKDMRSTEVSYLARGQALRVVELTEGLTRLSLLRLRRFSAEDPLAMGAVALLQDQETEEVACFLLAPAGAGTRLLAPASAQGQSDLEVVVLTVSSPLGRALLGQRVGDEVEFVVPAKKRVYAVLEIT